MSATSNATLKGLLTVAQHIGSLAEGELFRCYAISAENGRCNSNIPVSKWINDVYTHVEDPHSSSMQRILMSYIFCAHHTSGERKYTIRQLLSEIDPRTLEALSNLRQGSDQRNHPHLDPTASSPLLLTPKSSVFRENNLHQNGDELTSTSAKAKDASICAEGNNEIEGIDTSLNSSPKLQGQSHGLRDLQLHQLEASIKPQKLRGRLSKARINASSGDVASSSFAGYPDIRIESSSSPKSSKPVTDAHPQENPFQTQIFDKRRTVSAPITEKIKPNLRSNKSEESTTSTPRKRQRKGTRDEYTNSPLEGKAGPRRRKISSASQSMTETDTITQHLDSEEPLSSPNPNVSSTSKHDRPGPEVADEIRVPSSTNIYASLDRILTNEIKKAVSSKASASKDSPKKTSDGVVYIMHDPAQGGLFKIGKTTRDIEIRSSELESLCGRGRVPLFGHQRRVVKHVQRAEHLTHKQLERVNFRFDCNCKIIHKEWFRIEYDLAEKSVVRWMTFMEHEPYDKHGNLRGFWEWKLTNQHIYYGEDDEENSRMHNLAWDKFVAKTLIEECRYGWSEFLKYWTQCGLIFWFVVQAIGLCFFLHSYVSLLNVLVVLWTLWLYWKKVTS